MRTTKHLTALCAAMLATMLLASCSLQPANAPTPDQTQALTALGITATPTPTASILSTPEPTPEPAPEPEAFSIAWMSDTQAYTAADNDVLGKMTQWISDTQKEYDTVLTVHTGDIVYNAYKEYQWQNATVAFARVPKEMHIVTVAGNHDQLPDYDKHTPYLDHRVDTDFDTAHASDTTGYNYYTAFSAGGVPVIVFSLAYGFEVEAIDWVNQICKEYEDHYAVLCVHSYMSVGGYSSIGRRLIEGVVKKSPNIRLVLSGHEGGMVYIPEELDDDGDGTPDRTVHQMMMNVQDDIYNGVGYLRILRLDPKANTLEVITYSPVLDRYGYKSYVGDQFGDKKILEDAGIQDFIVKSPSAAH